MEPLYWEPFIQHISIASAKPRDQFFWLGEINKATHHKLPRGTSRQKPRAVDRSRYQAGDRGRWQARSEKTIDGHYLRAAAHQSRWLGGYAPAEDVQARICMRHIMPRFLREDLLSLADQLNKTARTLVSLAEKACRHNRAELYQWGGGTAEQFRPLSSWPCSRS